MRVRALILALALPLAALAEAVPEPEGYRGPPYQGAVPATLAGASVIDGAQAMALHAQGVPFVDVFPRTERPASLPEGTIWRDPRHDSVPGAVWLPDTGGEAPTPEQAARLTQGLAAVTRDDPTRPVVIFCRAHCWLSWNAAKRAVGLGYTAVHWFPEGVEGWEAAGGWIEKIAPPPAD